MDYDEEQRHQIFDAEQKTKRERMAVKRLAIVSIILIMLGGALILSGCASMEEMYTEYETVCRGANRQLDTCVELNDRIIAGEKRQAEKQFIEDYLESLTNACQAQRAVMLCTSKPKYKIELRSCGCIDSDDLSGLIR